MTPTSPISTARIEPPSFNAASAVQGRIEAQIGTIEGLFQAVSALLAEIAALAPPRQGADETDKAFLRRLADFQQKLDALNAKLQAVYTKFGQAKAILARLQSQELPAAEREDAEKLRQAAEAAQQKIDEAADQIENGLEDIDTTATRIEITVRHQVFDVTIDEDHAFHDTIRGFALFAERVGLPVQVREEQPAPGASGFPATAVAELEAPEPSKPHKAEASLSTPSVASDGRPLGISQETWDRLPLDDRGAIVEQLPSTGALQPPPPSTDDSAAWVTTDSLNLRTTPEVTADNANRIGTFPAGTPLTPAQNADGLSQDGDWIYVTGQIESQRVEGWVHSDYVVDANTAPATPPAPVAPTAGGPGSYAGQHFLGTNYTDIGMVNAANPTFDPGEAERDMARLRELGITEIRVWADAPGVNAGDIQGMANRIEALAEIAERQGMTLNVDLFDGHGNTELARYENVNDVIDVRINTIIPQCARFSNIRWSLGNEMQAPDRPLEFANWYAGKCELMRAAGAEYLVAHLVPGAAEHPSGPRGAEALQAMRIIAGSVDAVSIHLYPPTPIEQAGAAGWLELATFNAWFDLANEMGKEFTVGELAMDRGGHQNPEALNGWLHHFQNMGVDHVSLWQFAKDEGYGHIDPWSMDTSQGRNWVDQLRTAGWIN